MTSYFKNVIARCGIKFLPNDTQHVLIQEQSLVIRDLDEILCENKRIEQNVNEFLKTFKELIKNPENFKQMLQPTLLKKPNDVSDSRFNKQSSVIRIFMSIKCLQTEIIELLLIKLTEEICEDEVDMEWVQLILHSLKYLPFINEHAKFSSRLFEIIDMSHETLQMEFLHFIPQIIQNGEDSVKDLMNLLNANVKLTPMIIDSLNSFDFVDEKRHELQEYMVKTFMNRMGYYEVFTLLIEFILTNCRIEKEMEYLEKIRDTLDLLMQSSQGDKDAESNKVIIFKKLQVFLWKDFYKKYCRLLETVEQYKSIDLLIIFMFHKCTLSKRRILELFLRKNIKKNRLKLHLFEELFKLYFVHKIFNDYFPSMLKIAASLLQSDLIDYAKFIYQSLFEHKYADFPLRQEVIMDLIMQMDNTHTTVVLDIFFDLCQVEVMNEHVLKMMSLIKYISQFNLKNTKQVFDILCKLAYRRSNTSDYDNSSSLQNEIYMLAKKFITNYGKDSVHKGIVGIVAVIKHMTYVVEQSNIPVEEDMDIESLPENVKKAIEILQFTNKIIDDDEHYLTLYYDELSSMMIVSYNIDKYFLMWLHESLMNRFQANYISDYSSIAIENIDLKAQFNLNSTNDIDQELNINIGESIIKDKQIHILCPLFLLLRLLNHKLYDGDLEHIDALQGCGILLPELDDDDEIIIEDSLKVNCIYHTINWFREIISAFLTQTSRIQRQKTLDRINHIIELQEKYDKSIKMQKLRDIDTGLIVLIRYNLDLSLSSQIDSQRTQTLLNIKQLKFVLNDILEKMNIIVHNKDLGIGYLANIKPIDFIKDSIRLMPNFLKHLSTLGIKLENDGVDVIDNENIVDIKQAFALLLKFIATMLKWSGFQHQKHKDLYKDFLKSYQTTMASQTFTSTKRLTIEFAEYLLTFASHITHLSSAVSIIEIFQSFKEIEPSNELNQILSTTSEQFLKMNWNSLNGKRESGRQAILDIDVLINAFLNDKSIATLYGMVGTLQEQVNQLPQKNSRLEMLPAIDKMNFYVFYRRLCNALTNRIKCDLNGLTNIQHLECWRKISLTLQGLMSIAKVENSRSNLSCFLKNALSVLKVFLNDGMPILEIMLISHTDRVVEIFKITQTSTRYLHHLCCHSKAMKDSAVIRLVPRFRLTLETFVLRVKAALVANNCSSAFWIGNLKNRDLDGKEILTEDITDSEITSNNEEDDLQDEDESLIESDSDMLSVSNEI